MGDAHVRPEDTAQPSAADTLAFGSADGIVVAMADRMHALDQPARHPNAFGKGSDAGVGDALAELISDVDAGSRGIPRRAGGKDAAHPRAPRQSDRRTEGP